ncbi:MAG: DUF4388 domain-containing protein [Deltaproteobacteria bacterium]|nr:DUF4388 domain-containing protein [Deltaproteobacteria bacterium]
MHTGVAHQETLSQVLRNISQRRRQGVLEVRTRSGSVQIHFVQGKIVEMVEVGVHPVHEMGQSFVAAGFMSSEQALGLSSYRGFVSALRNGPAGPSAEDLVKRAIRHRILQKLYSLELEAPALHSFDSTMVEYQREFAPSISVGQLLLDVVALESDREKFLELFNPSVEIARSSADSQALSEEEGILYALLVEPLSLETLRARSMLSEFALQDALLRMLEQKFIVAQKAAIKKSNEDFLDAQMLSHLDAAIDEVFEEEGFAVAAGSAEQAEEAATAAAGELSIVREGEEPTIDADRGPLLSRGIKRRLALASARALHMHWVPAFVMALFLLCTLLVPLFLWQRVFEAFAG